MRRSRSANHRGSVAYVVDFRIGARRRRVTLGAVSEITLAEARDRAREIAVGSRRGPLHHGSNAGIVLRDATSNGQAMLSQRVHPVA
jgi:hypothetical protein